MTEKADPKNYKQAFNYLSEVYEVIKCFDKNTSKLNNKITELKSKFEKSRQLLNTINGIQMSYVEQQEYYESLLKQYDLKLKLLDSYKSKCTFDISELNNDINEQSKAEPLELEQQQQQQQQQLESSNQNKNDITNIEVNNQLKTDDMDIDFIQI